MVASEISNVKKKKAGRVIVATGFLMILANAVDYRIASNMKSTPLLIIGLVLVAVGISLSAAVK